MGRLTPVITGKAVAFDTSPLIYYINAEMIVTNDGWRPLTEIPVVILSDYL